MAAVRKTVEGVLLTVHVQPNAARTEYAGPHGDALKFRVAAPPAGGAANEALSRFLARQFGLPVRAVELLAGSSGRRKRLLLRGIDESRVRATFEGFGARPLS
jgi:uncharacterized protein (TIGR00251 family)